MPKVPQLPHPGNPVPHSRNPGQWVDLVAFLGILALGGVLMALGTTTASSLGAVCAALGGLYGVYKWHRPSGGPPPDADATKADQSPPAEGQ